MGATGLASETWELAETNFALVVHTRQSRPEPHEVGAARDQGGAAFAVAVP